MANRYFKNDAKTLEGGVVKLFGKFATTTSGTVGSQSCKGFSIAKTGSEVGRYTVSLEDQYMGLLGVSAIVVGPADAAYTGTKGLIPFLRNVSVTDSTPGFDIQFAQATLADAELMDGAEVYIEISLKNTTAF
jgi:hypothetical protein